MVDGVLDQTAVLVSMVSQAGDVRLVCYLLYFTIHHYNFHIKN